MKPDYSVFSKYLLKIYIILLRPQFDTSSAGENISDKTKNILDQYISPFYLFAIAKIKQNLNA